MTNIWDWIGQGQQQPPAFPTPEPQLPFQPQTMAIAPTFARAPEAIETPARQVLGGMAQGASGIGNALINMIAAPGRAFQAGYAGQPPTTEQMVPWGVDTALSMVGAGSPFAQPGALGAAGGGIKAYHGSPYDFERFSSQNIGTGEGAQAYGHGLYFAQNEATAKAYRDALGSFKGKIPDDIISLPPEMRQALQFHAMGDQAPLEAAKRVQWMSPPFRDVEQSKIADMISRFRDARQGKMYEVNIGADPEHFLDWDKPLSQQSEHVRDALRNSPVVKQFLADMPASSTELHPSRTGESIYGSLETAVHQPNQGHLDRAKVAESLREAGIPGIRYLDQGSRNAGTVSLESKYRAANLTDSNATHERFFADRYRANSGNLENTINALESDLARHPNDVTVKKTLDFARDPGNKFNLDQTAQTHNYVVFNDKLIEIMKKYGLAGLLGGSQAAPIFAPRQQTE